MRTPTANMRNHHESIFTAVLISFALVISILVSVGFAEDQKSDQPKEEPKSGYSVTPQKRDSKKSEEKKKTDDKKIPDDFVGPPLTPDGDRDLEALFEQSKREGEGSLRKIIQRQVGAPGARPKSGGADFVGPPLPPGTSPPPGKSPGKTPPSDFVGPVLPDINLPQPEEFLPLEETTVQLEFENASTPEKRKVVDLDADKITRDKLKHTIYLEGNAKVVYEDMVILSDFAEFNDDEDWGKFWGPSGVLCENEDGISKSESLEAFFADEEKVAYFHKKVEAFVYGREYKDKLKEDATRKEKLKRALGQDDTTIYCDEAEYYWGDKLFFGWVEDSEVVRIVQEGRTAEAKKIFHDRNKDHTILEENVKLWQKDGNWLFDRDVVTDKEDKWGNALLRPETTITCDILEILGEEEITTLEGNVLAVQKTKRAGADKAVHNEKEKIFTADGNVNAHQENGDWMVEYKIVDPKEETEDTMKDLEKPADGIADRFKMWTDTEDFEAEGNIRVWQEHQEAKMDYAKYLKAMDRLGVSGNVEVHREDKHNLFSNEGILWLTTKVYEAFGDVKSDAMLDVEKEVDKAKEEGKEVTEGEEG
jgi:lipopolysaccharide export system protein LptA